MKDMREILFKAKRIDNGEWVYGNYAYTHTDGEQYFIFQNKTFEYKVDKDTVCQYIGLTDKNSNKIWENDIVFDSDNRENYMIAWRESELCYVVRSLNEEGSPFDCNYGNNLEVIGNFFDNPELLCE